MRFDYYSFPHPILGREDDITGLAQSKLEIGNDGAENSFVFTVVHAIDNPDIQSLIDEGKAEYFTEVSCSSTLFRQSVSSHDPLQIFTIKKSALRGKVEFLFLVVASVAVPNYENSAAHAELTGLASDLDKGDVLAFLGQATFIADIEFKKMKASASFMEIAEGEQEKGDFEVELDHPKILIRLSKEDYGVYTRPDVGQNPQHASLFQSAVALPSLVYALQQISPTADKDDYKDKPWARTLLSRIENEIEKEGVTFDDESVMKIAQMLLGFPFERLLRDTVLSNKNGTEEDES